MGLVPSATILSTDEMGRIAAPIFTSVGHQGVNAPGDVFVIQGLLNDRLPKPHSPVPMTGEANIGLTLAIEAFQAVMMSMTPPSGRVDPGSPTYYALASRPLVAAATPKMGHFGQAPPEVIEAAVASRKRWQVPASITIAQWAVESAWGAAIPPGSNNPFGIKALATDPSVESPTREVLDGKTVVISAKFRKFDSMSHAFDMHGKLLATAAPYKPAMQLVDKPDAFADALTGVYATDPEYGMKLKWVINNYGWTQYDK